MNSGNRECDGGRDGECDRDMTEAYIESGETVVESDNTKKVNGIKRSRLESNKEHWLFIQI